MHCDLVSLGIRRLDRLDLLVGPVSKVVHYYFKLNLMVWRIEDRLVVKWYQGEIIKLVELVHQRWLGQWLGTVIRQPSGDVPVQVVGQSVEKVLRVKSVSREFRKSRWGE